MERSFELARSDLKRRHKPSESPTRPGFPALAATGNGSVTASEADSPIVQRQVEANMKSRPQSQPRLPHSQNVWLICSCYRMSQCSRGVWMAR